MKKDWRVARDYVKNNLELFIIPIFFLIILFGAKFLWTYFGLPTQDELIGKVQSFFLAYGLWVIFISSIIESMLFLGWYFPGSLVIFLGVAATTGRPLLAIQTVLVVCVGMLIGYSVNFILGRFGWYKVLIKFGFKDELLKIEERIKRGGMFHSFFLYVMPGFGSLLSTAFGVLKFSFAKFIAFTTLMVLFWNTVWGVAVYFFGMPLFKILTNPAITFLLFTAYLYYLHSTGKLKAMYEDK